MRPLQTCRKRRSFNFNGLVGASIARLCDPASAAKFPGGVGHPALRDNKKHCAGRGSMPRPRPNETRCAIKVQRVCFTLGNTAQFPPYGISAAPAAAARHLRCQNARQCRVAVPASCFGDKSPSHSATAAPASVRCIRRWRRSPLQHKVLPALLA